MTGWKHPALLAALALAGCEQTAQQLPFDVDDVVEQTIAAGGGTVSTPAGASVEFPSGSVGGPVQVTLEVIASPTTATASGASASETFKLEPAGLELAQAALAELKFSAASDPSRAWLASLVSTSNGRVDEHGDTRVELRTGLASSEISRLGSLRVVIPPADAVVGVTRSTARFDRAPLRSASLAVATSDSVVVDCGDPNDRCAGIVVTASDNLLDQVEDAAAVYPAIAGRLRLGSPSVTDSIVLNTAVRALLASGQTAENVTIHALVRPTTTTTVSETESEIRLSNVYFRVSGAGDAGSGTRDEVATLVITKGSSGGTIAVSRSFQMRSGDGELEDATISVRFPVEVYP